MGRVGRLAVLVSLGVGLRLLWRPRAKARKAGLAPGAGADGGSQGSQGVESDASPNAPYGYDVRRGATAYAPIIGSFGGFVVTAVVLVFGIVASHGQHPVLFGRATSLLVLGLIACMLSAFALGAIGAERELTADLPAASLYAGAATAIGVVAILAAFEVLATIYLRETKPLFALITAGAAIAAAVLVVLVLGDAWISTPTKHWLGTQRKSYFWASLVSGLVAAVLLAGTLLYFSGVHIAIGSTGTRWFVGIGIALAILGGLGSMFRTMHAEDGEHKPIAKSEACIVLGSLVGYLMALILLMP